MRHAVVAGAVCLLCTGIARGQINPAYKLPTMALSAGATDLPIASSGLVRSEAGSPPALDDSELPALGMPRYASAIPPDPPQEVYGVFPEYQWQASVGYTYVRFYEVSGVTVNANGVYGSVVYYVKDWVGAEGEVSVAFASLSGRTSHLFLGAGGARVRRPMSNKIELWAHGLVGGSTVTPRTPYGATDAFGWEAGAGIDINARRRWSYRIQGDALGTLYFNTYQISPKVSAGVVYKF